MTSDTERMEPVAWRPIETAPKDGLEVLICGGTFYYDACADTTPIPFEGVTIAWSRGSPEWCGGYGSEYDGEYWHKPTHWMPLPAPPAPTERDNNGLRDQVALEVLCRAFDDEPAFLMGEWDTFIRKGGWLHWSRALGAFIRHRLDRGSHAPTDGLDIGEMREVLREAAPGLYGMAVAVVRSWREAAVERLARAEGSTPEEASLLLADIPVVLAALGAAPTDGGEPKHYTDFADAESGRLYCGDCHEPLKADARGVYCDNPACQTNSGAPTEGGEPEIYCSRCGSCGEPGCCPTACDGGDGCLYAQTYAQWYHGLITGPREQLDEVVPTTSAGEDEDGR